MIDYNLMKNSMFLFLIVPSTSIQPTPNHSPVDNEDYGDNQLSLGKTILWQINNVLIKEYTLLDSNLSL